MDGDTSDIISSFNTIAVSIVCPLFQNPDDKLFCLPLKFGVEASLEFYPLSCRNLLDASTVQYP